MRLLVTRPEHDAKRTSQKLEALGHEVLCAPLLTVEPTTIPPPEVDYHMVLVTSANGAARLAALPGWEKRIVYAVGPRTADAVREVGEATDLRIAEGDAVSMVRLITAACERKSRIVHVTGVNHKAEPDASLRAAGFEVFTWTAYQAVATERLPEAIADALTDNMLDGALHYSRRSVAVLLQLLSADGLSAALNQLHHFCLSEDVAEPLRTAGLNTIRVAQHPSEDALLRIVSS